MASNSSLTMEVLFFQEDLKNVKKNFDMLFLVIMGNLVLCKSSELVLLLLTILIRKTLVTNLVLKAAFAFFEMSFVRSKNAVSVVFRNYLDEGVL
jgi:hypothetical protein